MTHPWEITLRQFIERINRDFGYRIESQEIPLFGPRGAERVGYVKPGHLAQRLAMTVGSGLDDLLPRTVLRSLCIRFGVPPEDFGLDPDPDD